MPFRLYGCLLSHTIAVKRLLDGGVVPWRRLSALVTMRGDRPKPDAGAEDSGPQLLADGLGIVWGYHGLNPGSRRRFVWTDGSSE
jgi:hypothetical protein